ncbi:MAG: type II toxin-antitoxin system HicA family toxin [Candidatus Coatesbacteria bacterium]
MPGRLGSVKPRQFIRRMQRAGFTIDHQTGSHVILLDSRGTRLTVPVHAREMKRGLLMDLLKQAGMSREEFQAR